MLTPSPSTWSPSRSPREVPVAPAPSSPHRFCWRWACPDPLPPSVYASVWAARQRTTDIEFAVSRTVDAVAYVREMAAKAI